MQRGQTEAALTAESVKNHRAGTSSPLRAGARVALRWVVERGVVLAAGLAASLPIVVSTIHSVMVGWVPLGDDAYVGVRSFDVLSDRSPLLGQWSSGATVAAGETAYSPGPLLFWLLAVPARFLGPSSLVVTIGLVNVASVVTAVALAHRRGGRLLMFASAVAVPLMLASLPAETHSDVWNSSAALLPFMLLLFLAWSVACGEYTLLPVTVLIASFVAQCHLTYVTPTLAVTAVALAGLAVSGRRRRGRRRWIVAAVVVGVACWSAPLVDQAVHRPGNLVLLVRAAATDEPTLGFDAGWRALVHAVGIVPWWLEAPREPLERVGDLSTSPGAVAITSAILLLASLAAVAVAGWRRRRSDIWAAGALGLGLSAAVMVDAASTPANAFETVGYTLRWTSPAGMWIWLAPGWSLATLLLGSVHLTARRQTLIAPILLAAVLATGTVVAIAADPPAEPYNGVRDVAERVSSEVPHKGAVRVDAASSEDTFYLAFDFQAGIVFSLRSEGRDVVAPAIAQGVGEDYDAEPGEYQLVVRVDVERPAPKRGRVIARLSVRDAFAQGSPNRALTVTLLPADGVR